jgi:hypothetical protein
MPRTTSNIGGAGFIADHSSIVRDSGRQVDWANVPASGATYDATTGKKKLPAGTVCGDTLGTGKISPRVVTTNPAVGIIETDAIEGDTTVPASGYGFIRGGAVYEALLPEATGSPRVLATAVKTELNAAGMGFDFQKWQDVR